MDWYSRRVLAWGVSNSMDASFCVEALEEAMYRYGKTDIFNTDSKNMSVSWFLEICWLSSPKA